MTCGSPLASTSSVFAQFQSAHVFTVQRCVSGMHGQSADTGAASKAAVAAMRRRLRMASLLRDFRLKLLCHPGNDSLSAVGADRARSQWRIDLRGRDAVRSREVI